jgi:thymidylate synthase
MKRILDTGVDRPDRTGIGSRAIWGAMVDIDLAEGFPIVTTRKTAHRIAFEETWFMLRGETDTKKLEEKKINIWKGNTTREFLDKRNLDYLPEGHMGKAYGFQWRNFGGDYAREWVDLHPERPKATSPGVFPSPGVSLDGGPTEEQKRYIEASNYTKNDGFGVDQIWDLLEGIKKDPNGRRHIVSGWNPQQISEMALPPCHLYQQYQVLNGKLNSSFVMRSHDWLYGGPFNFMGYALLNIAFSKYLGLEPGHLVYFGNDVHIYDNQLEMAKQQILREPFELPKLELTKDVKTFDDLLGVDYHDFKYTTEYKAHPDFKDKPAMAV